MKNQPVLSKSKYMAGLQCPKLLWFEYNSKHDIPAPDKATEAVFSEGRKVGEWAQKLFPNGIRIERDFNPERQSLKSLAALKLRQPLFEPGFVHKRAYALADILVPVNADEWDLIEVKSSTQVKEENYPDVAFQKYTYTGAGVKIRNCYIMYINRDYVRQGPVEPEKLFSKENVSGRVNELAGQVEGAVDELLAIVDKKTMPDVAVGQHCASPRDCPLYDLCWQFLPDKDHVFILYRGGKLRFELLERGIMKIADVPDGDLNEKQLIQAQSHKTGQTYIDKAEIKRFLATIKYPLYFLDFETLAPAVPAYDNTRPYLEIPFQYSLYKVAKEGAKPEHFSYLAPGDIDPRPEVLRRLKEELGETGSIIAYSSSFEIKVIKNASDVYREYKEWFVDLQPRFVDLLEPFKNFAYYHPEQAGSASLKNVLPALTGSSYEGLPIANGQMAAIEYMRVTFDPAVSAAEKRSVREALNKYCDLDTSGMIEILATLQKENE